MYTKFKSPDTLAVIEIRRLECLWHRVRMNDERTVKNLLEGKPGGQRKKERPRLRWINCVESDLRNVGVKRWTRSALECFGERTIGICREEGRGQT
jgi:hypothetical protein